MRDKDSTKQKLIDAVLSLLRNGGFASLGVNAVAAEAGVSKVVIYRYFGGLDGLLEAAAADLDMTKTRLIDAALEQRDAGRPLAMRISDALYSTHTGLAADELTLQLMKGELQQQNELTRSLAEARERQGLAATRRAEALVDSELGEGAAAAIDLEALLALFSAGIYYLTLRSESVRFFNGTDIQSEAGWRRICDAAARAMTSALESASATSGSEDEPR